jgi:tripartite-type tricarboxylate transporter receptor subunit TctC
MGTAALFGASGARFDAREFGWIGSLNSEVAVAIAWHTSPVKKAEDLFVQELVVGAAGATDQSNIFPTALNRVLGTRFKVVAGYRGSAENALALERGEVAGIGGMNFSSIQATRPDWLKDAKVNILLQLSLQRHPEMPNVPTALDIGRTDTEKAVLKLVFAQSQMGRAIFAPPGVSPDRLQVLRAAFESMIKDPDFLADANKSSIEINQPMRGPEMVELVGQLHASAPELIKRASEAIAVAGQ